MEPSQFNAADIRVLVVDDQSNMRRLLRSMLSNVGFRDVHEVPGGDACLEAVQALKPDVITLDWLMPGVDGLEVTRIIRRNEDIVTAQIPIIMVSGQSKRTDVIQARDAGVTEYLIKPFSPKALFDRIRHAIDAPRRFISAANYIGPDRRRFVHPNYEGEERRGGWAVTSSGSGRASRP